MVPGDFVRLDPEKFVNIVSGRDQVSITKFPGELVPAGGSGANYETGKLRAGDIAIVITTIMASEKNVRDETLVLLGGRLGWAYSFLLNVIE